MDTQLRGPEIELSFIRQVQKARYILDNQQGDIQFSDIAVLFPLTNKQQDAVAAVPDVIPLTIHAKDDNKGYRLDDAVGASLEYADFPSTIPEKKRRKMGAYAALGALCIALTALLGGGNYDDSLIGKNFAPKQWAPPPGLDRYADDGTLLQSTVFGSLNSAQPGVAESGAVSELVNVQASIFCLIPQSQRLLSGGDIVAGNGEDMAAPELDPFAYDRQWRLSRESGLKNKDFYIVWEEAGKLYEQNGGVYDWKSNEKGFYWQRVQIQNENGRVVMSDDVPTVAMELMPYVQQVIQRDGIELDISTAA